MHSMELGLRYSAAGCAVTLGFNIGAKSSRIVRNGFELRGWNFGGCLRL
jgi:hypothetical protein